MTTVHLILNAHIDPVWLWPWQSGLDALLATCRQVCALLETDTDLHFCKGEAWGYQQIQRVAPRLFARIRRLVDAGRWHIVGGWWIQPDCNAPSNFALRKQIEVGKQYFLEHFGQFPRTAYNVDSFGHAASLPELMRAPGQDRYVMMRPQEHELALPARLFRWRGSDTGREVVTFRIARGYACRDITEEHIRAAISDLPAGIEHTMCFVGLGDHGGGPVRRQIDWCRAHARSLPGCELVFSSPERFFDAIWGQRDALPVVTGELQSHAIGCYSVHRGVKSALRRTEHALRRAELVAGRAGAPEEPSAEQMSRAWQQVCFCQFHDILGGTCVPSAYEQVQARLGWAATLADETLQLELRRRLEGLPEDSAQRLVLWNASDEAYAGYVLHEPWFEYEALQAHWCLRDERNAVVPHQQTHPEALVAHDQTYFTRLLFHVRMGPGEWRVLRFDTSGVAHLPGPRVQATSNGIVNEDGVGVRVGEDDGLRCGARHLPLPQLELIEDPTDTWSHGVDGYSQEVVARPVWEATRLLDRGPLMASLQQTGRIGDSPVVIEYRVLAGEPFVELHLRVNWNERHKLLKLTCALPSDLVRRVDGIPGAGLERAVGGNERPVHDWSLWELADGSRVGLVMPDAYALDATGRRARVTLLRSPLLAHHDPYPGPGPRGEYADRGEHVFRFRLFCGAAASIENLRLQGLMLHRPPLVADLTRGMEPR